MLADVPYNKTTGSIIEAAIEVHRTLGPGLLESSYVIGLHYELAHRGMRFDSQLDGLKRVINSKYRGPDESA